MKWQKQRHWGKVSWKPQVILTQPSTALKLTSSRKPKFLLPAEQALKAELPLYLPHGFVNLSVWTKFFKGQDFILAFQPNT